MRTTSKRTYTLLVAMLVVSMAASQGLAWNPPGGRPGLEDRLDLATLPPTPTTLLTQAHGYIIQNGISILYNDGYWFAAQFLREWQQELLNGIRYADVYRGRGTVELQLCFFGVPGLFSLYCETLVTDSYPLAARSHYFNPETGQGLDMRYWNELSLFDFGLSWILVYLFGGAAYLDAEVQPGSLDDVYPSALELFEEEYANALNAYFDDSAPSIGGRQGTALAMFYLGWASHFLQDLTVVHHTFDAFMAWTGHSRYEAAADGLGETFAPVADGHKRGIYEDELQVVDCSPGSRTCFPAFAAHVSHDPAIFQAVRDGDYSHINDAIPFAQNLQAGLYAAFLTDIGLRPVHMSAVMAAL